jgi:hypothetical protein
MDHDATPRPKPTQVAERPPVEEVMPPLPLKEIMPPSLRIGRILYAVDRKYWEQEKGAGAPSKVRVRKYVSPSLDYHALEESIEASIAHYKALVEADEFLKRCEALIELRREAVKKARELLALVRKIDDDGWGKNRSDDWEDQAIDQIKGYVISKYEDEIKDLEHQRDLGGWHSEEVHRWGVLRFQCGRWTPIEWLVGCYLLHDFKAHFTCRPGTNENSPYIKFVLQVLAEFGIKPYAWGTIAKAVRDLRHNRGKRRRKQVTT